MSDKKSKDIRKKVLISVLIVIPLIFVLLYDVSYIFISPMPASGHYGTYFLFSHQYFNEIMNHNLAFQFTDYPPGYYLPSIIMQFFFVHSMTSIRLAMLVFVVILFIYSYRLLRLLGFSKSLTVLTSAAILMQPNVVSFSHEILPDFAETAMAIALMFYILKSDMLNKTRYSILAAIFFGWGMMTKFDFFVHSWSFAVIVFFLAIVLKRKTKKRIFNATLFIGIAFLIMSFWYVPFYSQLSARSRHDYVSFASYDNDSSQMTTFYVFEYLGILKANAIDLFFYVVLFFILLFMWMLLFVFKYKDFKGIGISSVILNRFYFVFLTINSLVVFMLVDYLVSVRHFIAYFPQILVSSIVMFIGLFELVKSEKCSIRCKKLFNFFGKLRNVKPERIVSVFLVMAIFIYFIFNIIYITHPRKIFLNSKFNDYALNTGFKRPLVFNMNFVNITEDIMSKIKLSNCNSIAVLNPFEPLSNHVVNEIQSRKFCLRNVCNINSLFFYNAPLSKINLSCLKNANFVVLDSRIVCNSPQFADYANCPKGDNITMKIMNAFYRELAKINKTLIVNATMYKINGTDIDFLFYSVNDNIRNNQR